MSKVNKANHIKAESKVKGKVIHQVWGQIVGHYLVDEVDVTTLEDIHLPVVVVGWMKVQCLKWLHKTSFEVLFENELKCCKNNY